MNGSYVNGQKVNGDQINGHKAKSTSPSRSTNFENRLHLDYDASPNICSVEAKAMLQLLLENLNNAVKSALSYLEGPLKGCLRESLHNGGGLPDPTCSLLAAETTDLLHRTQKLLDPKTVILADHFLGYVNSKCLNAAVERNIPEALAHGPMTLEQLAVATESRGDRLSQILRILYNNGIFDYDESTSLYSNNDTSSLLCSDHWTQWRNWVELYGNQFYDVARGIPDSTKREATRTGAQINYDTDLNMFTYFQNQGWVELLHRTLGGGAIAMAPGILEDYNWSEVENNIVMDIGGGGGGLITSLLRKFKNMRGGIFDLPGVITHAKSFFHDENGKYADVRDRILPSNLIPGDFFKSVPSFEIYTMKWCLHDWKDHDALRILNNIRKAIIAGPNSRLIIMESILADGHSQRLSRYGDIHMMMTANGHERTEHQWRELAKRSGWEIVSISTLRNAWVKAMDFRPTNKGYVMGHDNAEVERLSAQHEWLKVSMGTLVHCPVNNKKENMRILDSGTADGLWLEDVASTFPKSTTYIGTDIAAQLFPASPKPSFEFFEQSVVDPWPEKWQSSFDLVHQRLVLAVCDPASAKQAVETLFSLVKPGGWIQLIECDHSGGFTIEQMAQYPSTVKFGELVIKALAATNKSGQYGLMLRGWLREAGAIDVVETQLDCPVGSRAATSALKESTKNNLLSVVENLKMARKDIPNLGLDEEFFDVLYKELLEELTSKGSTQRFHLVYGRKPLSTKAI